MEHDRFGSWWQRTKDILRNGYIDKKRLAVDIIAKPDVLPGERTYERIDRWTDETGAELEIKGYRRVKGLHDGLIWANVPVYLKFSNLKQFDIAQRGPGDELLYSQDMSSTLHDFMTSNAQADFVKGMHKTRISQLSIEQIGLIAIVAVGGILGLYMMGII